VKKVVKIILILLAIILSQSAGRRQPIGLQTDNNASTDATAIQQPSSAMLLMGRPDSPRGAHPPDWLDELLERIWLAESGGQISPPDGDSGAAVGPLQIHQGAIDDVNKYYGTEYKLEDVREIGPAREVARLYITLWMDRYKEEIAARVFNGGPRGWRKKATDEYWRDVKND